MKSKSKPRVKDPFLVHNHAQAASVAGVRGQVLTSAKKAGAGGFRPNGNVHIGELCGWALTKGKHFEPGPDLDKARATLIAKKAELLEREAAEADGKLVNTDDAAIALRLAAYLWNCALPSIVEAFETTPAPADCRALYIALQAGWVRCVEAAIARHALPKWASDALLNGALGVFTHPTKEECENHVQLFRKAVVASATNQLKP